MAVFRMFLWFNKKYSFWKLMGSGKNGTFSKAPDWRQWTVLLVKSEESAVASDSLIFETPAFFKKWWKFFGCDVWTIILKPIEGHGTWDHQQCFGDLPRQTDYEGRIAVLTRATIRINKLNRFWKHVDDVSDRMATAEGFITSFGIGEVPWIKQATFSVWESKMHMKQFAYQSHQHKDVVQKTRSENWYSEDMFTRFTIISSHGTLHGKNPLERMS